MRSSSGSAVTRPVRRRAPGSGRAPRRGRRAARPRGSRARRRGTGRRPRRRAAARARSWPAARASQPLRHHRDAGRAGARPRRGRRALGRKVKRSTADMPRPRRGSADGDDDPAHVRRQLDVVQGGAQPPRRGRRVPARRARVLGVEVGHRRARRRAATRRSRRTRAAAAGSSSSVDEGRRKAAAPALVVVARGQERPAVDRQLREALERRVR